jgi:uncharacterized protein
VAVSFSLLRGAYAVAQLEATAPVPAGLFRDPGFVSVTRTDDELSIVCPQERVPAHARCEAGWRMLELIGPFAFDAVGVLASVAGPLAEAGISIVTVSTFNTDYVLVRAGDVDRAVSVLEGAGHTRRGSATPS